LVPGIYFRVYPVRTLTMKSMQDSSYYKWYILLLAMMTYGSIAGSARLCMPVLFPEIAAELGLSMVAIGTIWGMDPLAGVFLGLPGGLLADRFGVKRTLTVVCILAGVFGALRGFSVDFLSMAAFMFLFGLMAAVTPSIIPKVTTVWFAGKHLGMANGMLNVAWAVGAVFATLTSATLFSPWLGGWQNVLFFFGVPPVLMGLLWWLTGREPPKQDTAYTPVSGTPFRKALSSVIHIRDVWIMGIVLLTYWGTNMGFGGYLPTYLRNVGWEAGLADSAMTAFMGIGVLGVIPMVLFSDKIGSRKIVMMFAIFVLALSMGLIPLVNTMGVWIFLIVGGILRSGVAALGNTLILETKGVGGTFSGTAIGLTNTLGMLGAFVSPPIGNSLTAFNADLPIFFWAILGVAALPLLLMVKETNSTTDNGISHQMG
jgi:NNP family nitrate/nitrite transporter-like MFS transporter